MSSRFAITVALAFLAAALPTAAMAETITIEEFMAATPDAKAAADAAAAAENPLEDVILETPASVLPTPAAQDRPPYVYVIVAGCRAGDSACCVECAADATVGSVLKKAYYPQPIDFTSAKIAVRRPRQHVKEDLTVKADEEILRVEWDAKADQPTAKTNHRLQPNDWLIVTLPPGAVVAQAPMPVPVLGYYTPQIQFDGAPVMPHPILPEEPQAVVFAAIPNPVPSPYCGEPPVAVARALVGEPSAPIVESTPASPSTVRFDVVVLEDTENSFAEFEQLQSRMPFMLSDTETFQGTLRILEKHNLVRRVAEPKLLVITGQEAMIEIGNESPNTDEPWQGFKAKMGARELGGGLAVEFSFKNTAGRRTNEVQTSLIVPHGQTVVMKTGAELLQATEGDDAAKDKVEHAVYVVLTPEIVK